MIIIICNKNEYSCFIEYLTTIKHNLHAKIITNSLNYKYNDQDVYLFCQIIQKCTEQNCFVVDFITFNVAY